jgi:hypothetical protein
MRGFIAALAVALSVAAPAQAQAHSHRHGHWVARVTVIDHTGGTWPGVTENVAAWSRSRYVRAKVSDYCVVHTYCVTVEAQPYGDTGWGGATQQTGSTSATVMLNTSAVLTPEQQSGAVCHELGHTLGIAHPDPASSRPGVYGCIASTDPGLFTTVASPADRAQVKAIATGTPVPQGCCQSWGTLWVLDLVGRQRR